MKLRGLLLAGLVAVAPAVAQQPARSPGDLDKIQKDIEATEKERADKEAERAKIDAELQQLQTETIKLADDVEELERDLSQADNRVVELETREFAYNTSLQTRRAKIAPLLAALQRLRRDPPPALAVEPDDAVAAARGAMLIADVAEKLEVEASALKKDLAALADTRSAIERERDAALERQARLDKRREELAGLIEKRQAMVDALNQGVTQDLDKIAALEARASDMTDLLNWIESNGDTVAKSGGKRAKAGNGPVTVASKGSVASFASSKGKVRWPAAGKIARHFGEPDADRGASQGLMLATRADAQVVAPADGEIVFAGPFGDFGRLLILSPAEGYFILIGGLGRLDAASGQHVLKGEPLGAMASGANEAQMYIELRKNGTPVDPAQWFEPAEASG